ncbi:Gfo/Idh/MocA family protein [Sorangium cellulosum]|uniref:Gfo/Idh/MocA family protein n=1 Tax=Sorangium cellulosum TaxID=56 RepID=UPI003D9A79EF
MERSRWRCSGASTARPTTRASADEAVDFLLRFPSGARAVCSTSYGCHQSKRLRVVGPEGWAEMASAARRCHQR